MGSTQLPTREWSKKSWHRRASKPVTLWMSAFLLAGLTHILIPNYRWVLIHIFTLGVLTNSVVLWSQHLTEKFLQQKCPDSARPWQLRRMMILQAGITLTIAGQWVLNIVDWHWLVTQVGSGIVAAVLLWHAVSLGAQWWRAPKSKPFRPAVAGFVGASLALPVGAVMGALLAMELPGAWQDRLRAAHLIINLTGFVGLAAASALTVLFPALWRTSGLKNRATPMLSLIAAGVVTATGGMLIDARPAITLGLLLSVAGWLVGLQGWITNTIAVLRDPRDRVTYAPVSALLAALWFVGTTGYYAITILFSDLPAHEVPLPTTALLVGFAAQLLLGVMSYLLPTTMGGGPSAVRAGLRETGRAGLFRLTLINLGLAIWLASENSWVRVVMSLLCLGSLAAFVPLLIRSVRAQRGVLMKFTPGPDADPAARPAWNQVTAGVAVISLILALFGGLHGSSGPAQSTPAAAVSSTGNEAVTEVEVTTRGMAFVPDRIEVPAGNRLIITFTNTDSMDHDLKFASGAQSGRLSEGESTELDLGIITADIAGWCTIAGHKTQGMVIDIAAVPADQEDSATPGAPSRSH